MRSPRDLRCGSESVGAGCFGRDFNELGGRALSTVDWGRPWGRRTDVASHTNLATIRGCPVTPPNRPRRALECGSAQGSREKRLHSQNRQIRVTSISSTNGVHPGGSQLVVQAVERAVCHPENDRRRAWSPDYTEPNGTAAHDGDGAQLDDGFQLGDAIRWLIFLVPGEAALLPPGPVGAAGAAGNRRGGGALAGLPAIWRRVCCRPVYLPYTALLRRHVAGVRGLRGIRIPAPRASPPTRAWRGSRRWRNGPSRCRRSSARSSGPPRVAPRRTTSESDDNAAAADDARRLDRLSGDGADSEGTATTGTGTGTTTRRRMTRSAPFGRRNAALAAARSRRPVPAAAAVATPRGAQRDGQATLSQDDPRHRRRRGFQARLWVLSPDESPPASPAESATGTGGRT